MIGDISVTSKKLMYNLDVLVAELQSELDDHKTVKTDAERSAAVEKEAGLYPGPKTFCREFNERADAIEARLACLEQLMEDSACWNAYRSLQMHQQFHRIEAILRRGQAGLRQRGAIQGLPAAGSPQADPPEPMPPALLDTAAIVAGRREEWFA